MYGVKTDHQIVAINKDLMHLIDEEATLIAAATRSDDEWTVTADGVEDVTTSTRSEAIIALTEQALASLGGTGYSTLVPRGLSDQP